MITFGELEPGHKFFFKEIPSGLCVKKDDESFFNFKRLEVVKINGKGLLKEKVERKL